MLLFYAFYAFGAVFIMCELSQRITNSFEDMSDKIQSFEWYLFPREIQKILPINLIATQQPVVLECFGSVGALRETFKKVSPMKNAMLIYSFF